MAPAASLQHEHTNTVCVMDASGFLGSNLVSKLLQRGYSVHAAVLNRGKLKLSGASHEEEKKLKVFNTDPFDYESIMDALRGCSGLFYNFEPPYDQPSYDEHMVEVEVRAAHNVIEACAQTDTIDKVVFTSSVTAVIWGDQSRSIESEFDEKHWSDISVCRKFKLWHALSKTLAEKTAWALAMDRSINMVSVNTGLLLDDPQLSLKTPYLKGAAEMYEDGVLVTVHISFLVDAHICVFEDIASYGRYLCFNHVVNCPEDAVKLDRVLAPSTSVPQSYEQDLRIIQQRISNKKLNKLMVNFESGSHVVN